ncbi:iron ABC transporter substrate-binding protein [Nostoc linckia z18]|uniref:Iron ABC transporter substrate-binding protein n=2 Tax=Nostoc linckia TaxID=92942 RepID=A0A9Q5Z590_NOSLI|nr:ABC transporter substrate-binding protein [Nostoc linckia]PHK41144.1 iron ABC transporter substrate-binding protein [Nostoc linckia z15]PHK44889.1 iron ABC transporter substrate-binding protein [Nostoc linckia z16]PHJ58240.1 iron ABC transporter substrate-binding protein [Nostoc linckia z1]PHJ64378.1 iron ABC transporter substrate-binding protein [Nostoc linckia z2]PHJ65080.1 iron ABC transporter substrate-binding protein [Nostoc linckia z3]
MYHRWFVCALAFFLSIALVACNTVSTQQLPAKVANTTETTNTNSQQLPKKSATRVVALSSLSADIIAQLDQTKIVGITGSKLFKDDSRFKDIPRVSEGQNSPNLEKIVALKPDLVIGAEGFSTIPIQKIQQLGIPTLLTQVNNWESLEKLTKTLAELIDADPQPLLNRYQSFLPNKPNESLTTLVLVSRQPILAPNKNSWAGDLLTKFQVKNLAAELQGKSPVGGYITLSAEKIIEANPDAIILVNPPQGNSQTELLDDLKKESFWKQLQATQNNRVYVFDYYGLVNPGSINAIEKACQKLQQDLLRLKGT